MDQILLVLFVETCRYLSPFLVFWLKLVDKIHHSKLLAILTNRLFMFRHGHCWIYADGQGLPSMPCMLALLPFVVFLSIRSPFVTENQLRVSNKLMEHGTNGTTCHQEHLRPMRMALLVDHSYSKELMVKIKQ
jgi:hypothetical protein